LKIQKKKKKKKLRKMSSDLKRLLPRNGLTLGPKPQVMCRLARDASVVAALMALGGVDIFDRQFLCRSSGFAHET